MAVDCASDCDLLADVDNVSNFKTYIWEGCLSYKATSEFEVFFDAWLTIERFKDAQKRMKEKRFQRVE
ncbi:peptide deformylase [Caudoviricetes sp.]|nr:peptide deformylase [Caudoviricetes sp.]